MSSLIVEVCRVERVLPHPNADLLELAHIKGWQCVVPRGKYAPGSLVTYVPIDSVLPEPLSERLGVTKYLSKGRVRCARLRGEPSFGLIMDREDPGWAGSTTASQSTCRRCARARATRPSRTRCSSATRTWRTSATSRRSLPRARRWW